MALSTAPTGEVVEVLEAAEVSELVLGVTASLHHKAGAGCRDTNGISRQYPWPGADCRGRDYDLKTEITDN